MSNNIINSPIYSPNHKSMKQSIVSRKELTNAKFNRISIYDSLISIPKMAQIKIVKRTAYYTILNKCKAQHAKKLANSYLDKISGKVRPVQQPVEQNEESLAA